MNKSQKILDGNTTVDGSHGSSVEQESDGFCVRLTVINEGYNGTSKADQ